MNELHKKKLEVHFLGRLGLGEQFFLYLLKPISAADLKGLNIRVSPMYLQLVKGLGGNRWIDSIATIVSIIVLVT